MVDSTQHMEHSLRTYLIFGLENTISFGYLCLNTYNINITNAPALLLDKIEFLEGGGIHFLFSTKPDL